MCNQPSTAVKVYIKKAQASAFVAGRQQAASITMDSNCNHAYMTTSSEERLS